MQTNRERCELQRWPLSVGVKFTGAEHKVGSLAQVVNINNSHTGVNSECPLFLLSEDGAPFIPVKADILSAYGKERTERTKDTNLSADNPKRASDDLGKSSRNLEATPS